MAGPQTASPAPAAGDGRGPAAGPARPGRPSPAVPGRRPWWVWAAPFAVVLAVLAVRSRFLFTDRFYEQGDAGANSILIQQAMHGTLLIGNYSREGFNHPGPAFLYVQAAGQWLLTDALHLVPAAWNAHVLATFILNSAFVSMITGVVYGWTRSVRGAAACVAVLLGFAATQPSILSLDWMPWMYVPAYLAFLAAAASVAAGAARDLWILTLAGWFALHGHACFLFLVPVVLAAVLVAVERQFGLRASLRAFARPRAWIPVAVISAVFALPIAANLILHWPGDFGRYFSYGSSGRAGGHPLGPVVRYVVWYWWQGGRLWAAALVPVVLYAIAIAAIAGLTRGRLRRFLAALLAVNVVSTAAFAGYVAAGIDSLSQHYIGYFYFSAPILTLLVIAVAVVQAPPAPVGTALAIAAAAAAVTAFAIAPGTAVSTQDTDAALPGAVQAVAAQAHGQAVVIRFSHDAWIDVTGFLVQAGRTGVPACVADPSWSFMMSPQLTCDASQLARGTPFYFSAPAAPPGLTVIATLRNSQITPGTTP
jgi:hypothetical protein